MENFGFQKTQRPIFDTELTEKNRLQINKPIETKSTFNLQIAENECVVSFFQHNCNL